MPRNAVKSVLVSCVFSLWACATGSALAASPVEFIEQARTAGIAEIESSRLAIQRTSATDINSFAVEMIKDYTNTNRHLSELADRLGLSLAPVEQLEQQARAAMFEAPQGDGFDAAYVVHQIEAHEAMIKLFQQQAEDPEVPALQELVRQTLPTLEMHLAMAKKLQMTHRQDE
ncbi:DUF4142 domain-containing protein [Pseudomonas putida]|uniref:DUF4142 domain-containing protein n=1 Tax=Pseudomonas putida TaxID=303 RepID=UPI0023640EEA|nr:DUF4142 domain-containing protein [Pseudomonas putida]MDD2051077.1 DUF4142 domain-containing protein [Pseudomonas putida]